MIVITLMKMMVQDDVKLQSDLSIAFKSFSALSLLNVMGGLIFITLRSIPSSLSSTLCSNKALKV